MDLDDLSLRFKVDLTLKAPTVSKPNMEEGSGVVVAICRIPISQVVPDVQTLFLIKLLSKLSDDVNVCPGFTPGVL